MLFEEPCVSAVLAGGAPDDTTIFQWFSMCKYTLETKIYVAKAAFTINPVDGVVHRVAISLKRKDGR